MIVRALWPLSGTPCTVPVAGVGAGESRGPCTGSLGAPGAPVEISCSQDAAFVFRHLANQQAEMIVRALWPLSGTPCTERLAGVGVCESRGPCTGSLGARDAPEGISCSQDAAFVSVTWPISRLI